MDPNGGEPGISSQGMSRRSLARDCSAAWGVKSSSRVFNAWKTAYSSAELHEKHNVSFFDIINLVMEGCIMNFLHTWTSNQEISFLKILSEAIRLQSYFNLKFANTSKVTATLHPAHLTFMESIGITQNSGPGKKQCRLKFGEVETPSIYSTNVNFPT